MAVEFHKIIVNGKALAWDELEVDLKEMQKNAGFRENNRAEGRDGFRRNNRAKGGDGIR